MNKIQVIGHDSQNRKSPNQIDHLNFFRTLWFQSFSYFLGLERILTSGLLRSSVKNKF